MRAPRWFRDFSAWRWAPCVALIAGAFAFIALALLLIPIQFAAASRFAAARPLAALGVPPQVTSPAASPEPSLRVVTVRAAPLIASTARQPALALAPVPVPDEAPARAASPPDFEANIADRGDRPRALPARSRSSQ